MAVDLTSSCRCCDTIPKHLLAGTIDYDRKIQYMHNGIQIKLHGYYDASITRIITNLSGHHEPQEELLFHHLLPSLPDGSLIMELGSYWAYYSLWFLHSVPRSLAVCVEPIPSNLEVGVTNADLNKLRSRSTFINGFIQTSLSETPLFIDWDHTQYKSEPFHVDTWISQTESVPTLLHIDVQGAELSALKTAHLSLSQAKIKYLMVSTHGSWLHLDVVRLLKMYNYSILAEFSPLQSFSDDGLVYACSPFVLSPNIPNIPLKSVYLHNCIYGYLLRPCFRMLRRLVF